MWQQIVAIVVGSIILAMGLVASVGALVPQFLSADAHDKMYITDN